MERADPLRPAPAPPDHPAELARGRAEVALELKKYSLAERIARECIAQAPENADGYWFLARALRGLGRRTDALSAAREAQRRDPGEPAYAQLVGLLLLELGSLPAASEVAVALVAQRPDWSPVWDLKARVHLARGEVGAAEEAARTLVSLQPESPDAFRLLGRVLWERGHHAEAHDCFTTGLHLDPQHPGCLAGMVSWLLHTKRFVEARALARDLIRVAPEDSATAQLYARTVGYAHPLLQPLAIWAFTLASRPRWQRFGMALLLVVPYLGGILFAGGVLTFLTVAAWRRVRRIDGRWRRPVLVIGGAVLGVLSLPIVFLLIGILYPVAMIYLLLARLAFRLAMTHRWFL